MKLPVFCGRLPLKWVLFSLAVLTAGAGIGLEAVGITALVREDWLLVSLLEPDLCPKVGVLLIVLGLVVMALAALATYGAWRGSRQALVVFFVLTLTLFLLSTLTLVIEFSVSNQTAFQDVGGHLERYIDMYDYDLTARHRWDFLQSKYECCGAYGPADWERYLGKGVVPLSCCWDYLAVERCNATRGSYQLGCQGNMAYVVRWYTSVMGATSAAAVLLLLPTMVLARELAAGGLDLSGNVVLDSMISGA